MDDLLDIISKHRQVYIQQLLEFYKERTEGARELLVKMNSEKEELLFDLSRMDYLLKENENWKIEELSPTLLQTIDQSVSVLERCKLS